MKLIVGLGNPGRSYEANRHNIGFRVIDLLAGRHGIDVSKRSFGALVGSGSIGGTGVLLVKPQTFMNLSGDAVMPIVGFYKLPLDQMIAVHDDIDIDLGRMKLAIGAGHGGHNGIRSIIDALGENEFLRVRVGVGRPPAGMDAADYVLHDFDNLEIEVAERMICEAADATEMLIREGLLAAQQKHHASA